MENKIIFKNIPAVRSIGRNGAIKTSGIEIFTWGEGLEIVPLTSKGQYSNCQIVFPVEQIDELIELLKTFK